MSISPALQKRIDKLPHTDIGGTDIIAGFGLLVEIRRDTDQVEGFYQVNRRGAARLTPVDYIPYDDFLREPVTGELIRRSDKHLFITEQEFAQIAVAAMMNGQDLVGEDGTITMSLLRDPRANPPIYRLKSFRQIVGAYEKRA